MPLKSGKSKKTISGNIALSLREFKDTGKIGASKPKSLDKAAKQASAIAYSKAGKKKPLKKAMGGEVSYVKKRDGNRPVKIS
jgi:hypothetical protein